MGDDGAMRSINIYLVQNCILEHCMGSSSFYSVF